MLEKILFLIIPLLLAITLHEAAHAWTADKLGDKTARMLGRVTVNPIAHIDLIGTVLLPLSLYILSSGTFTFGYAKPVPVMANNLKNPKAHLAIVALAGPLANLLLAFIFLLLSILFNESDTLRSVATSGVLINLLLFAFNLLPLLPLDGGRVLLGLLPDNLAYLFAKTEKYGMFIILGLIALGHLINYNIVSELWVMPLVKAAFDFLSFLLPINL